METRQVGHDVVVNVTPNWSATKTTRDGQRLYVVEEVLRHVPLKTAAGVVMDCTVSVCITSGAPPAPKTPAVKSDTVKTNVAPTSPLPLKQDNADIAAIVAAVLASMGKAPVPVEETPVEEPPVEEPPVEDVEDAQVVGGAPDKPSYMFMGKRHEEARKLRSDLRAKLAANPAAGDWSRFVNHLTNHVPTIALPDPVTVGTLKAILATYTG